jgi:hypothetical protein
MVQLFSSTTLVAVLRTHLRVCWVRCLPFRIRLQIRIQRGYDFFF